MTTQTLADQLKTLGAVTRNLIDELREAHDSFVWDMDDADERARHDDECTICPTIEAAEGLLQEYGLPLSEPEDERERRTR